MSYIPIPKAPGEPLEKYVDAELNDLARALVEPKENFTLQTLYAAPAKPTEGMVCKADGTTWNPGSGAGTYQYRAGTWRAWEGGGGGGGTESNGFASIAVAGQSTVSADTPTDTLTLVAGTNVTITTNAGSDTITISASGGGGGGTSNGYMPGGW